MTDPERAAQALIVNARQRGLTVTLVGDDVFVFGPHGSEARSLDIFSGIELHRPALVALLSRTDAEQRFIEARGMFPDPGQIEGT